MKTCSTCGGRGEVATTEIFVVQLREFQKWSDYLHFITLDEAIACAEGTQWMTKARVRRDSKVVWP